MTAAPPATRSASLAGVSSGVAVLAGATAAGDRRVVVGRSVDRHRASRSRGRSRFTACLLSAQPARWRRSSRSGRSSSRLSLCRPKTTGCWTSPVTGRCVSERSPPGAWAVCATLLVPLTVSDVSGHPVARAVSIRWRSWSADRHRQHGRCMAMDRIPRRGGDDREPAGAALVVDAFPVRRLAGGLRAARA